MSRRHRHDSGFSLLEVLVATTLVGLTATAAALAFSGARDPLHLEAERLAARLRHAELEALSTGYPVGFSAGETGYVFTRYEADRWERMESHPTLGARTLEDGMLVRSDRVRLSWNPRAGAQVLPEVTFDPAGINPPFRVTLMQGERSLAVERDEQGVLRIAAVEG